MSVQLISITIMIFFFLKKCNNCNHETHSLSFSLCILRVCVIHVFLFFCMSTFDGFVAHVWVDTYHFVTVSRTLLPCSLVCLCVGWLNVSYVLGAIHHIVIVWGCVCVLSVCMSCVRFCGDVVEGFCFCALRVCGCRSAKVNTRWKNETNPQKKNTKRQHHEKPTKNTWKQQSQQQITAKGITEQEITKILKHEKTKSWNKPLEPHTHATDTQWIPWENITSRLTRKNNHMLSSLKWFTASCNSQCLSHFVAAFIVVRAKTSIIHLQTINENGKY